jgi:GT2 family glycosyltransferase
MIPVLAIPVLNRYDLLDKNLSLIDFPIKEILIINNGKENYEPQRKDLNIRVLNLPSNLGMSGSWNLTIKLYPHEKFWLFSSADTHWIPGSLEKFYKLSSSKKVIASSQGFSCFSIGEDVVRKIGLFDEYFYPYMWEDSEYADRFSFLKNKNQYSDLGMDFNAVKVIVPEGPAQSINSDPKLFEKYESTRQNNRDYYDLKVSQDFRVMGQWDIDRRREQEWLP